VNITLDLQNACEGAVPSEASFQKWLNAALGKLDEEIELSVRLVDALESATLNETYRNKSGPTNVLSFPFDAPVELSPRLLGDLVMCAPIVRAEAIQQDKQETDHWAHMAIHGCLHLLGYDHVIDNEAEAMEALEVKILRTLDIADPYEADQ
jgi:probable rRNA maturation factor